jgi:hypothetical protein
VFFPSRDVDATDGLQDSSVVTILILMQYRVSISKVVNIYFLVETPFYSLCIHSAATGVQPWGHNWGATWKKKYRLRFKNREYGRRDQSRWPRGSFYPQKLALTSPTSGGRSVGILRSRTQPMEFLCLIQDFHYCPTRILVIIIRISSLWASLMQSVFIYLFIYFWF